MWKKVQLIVGIITLTVSLNTYSQLGFEYDDSLLVKIAGNTLRNPWAGGLNYAQFSDFDYDFDGDLDLFVFDRSSDNIRVFSQEDDGVKYYKFVYDAKSKFPSGIRYRATMVDYDNDGRKDLFTYGIGGMMVYRNVGDAVNGLQWELFSELLYSQYPNNYSNLNVSASDIPAIIDVDGDGDIDILTYSQSGLHVEYHKNQSMELYGIPDSLVFVLKNECWGKFSEDPNTNDITLNDPNVPCVGGNIPNPEVNTGENKSEHSGSTLLALDYDDSGVLDLIIGDASFSSMSLLINGGTSVNSDSPMISVDYAFPSNTTPINMQLFPAAFYVDVDFDGVKDLIVGANAKNVSSNERSILFYKNNGSNSNPNFIYSANNFLQGQMIEEGTGSVPIFFDFNEDGLKDLIVACFYQYKPVLDKESVVAYYKNTGTANEPIYTFIDNDVFNFSMESYGLRSIPSFGDLDNDGDEDMLLGVENGTLVYFENNSTGSGADFGPGAINYTDNLGSVINAGGYSHPQIFDLNNDGLLDLILGKRSGEIIYYENIGTASYPLFELRNAMLGGIDVSTTTPDGYSAPHFFRFNNETHLFLGCVDGNMLYYTGIDGNLDSGEVFTLESNDFLGINVEAYSAFWTDDVDNNGRLDLFVGQDLGGIYHFEVNPNSSASVNETSASALIAVYPNPVGKSLTIAINNATAESYQISDLNGHVLAAGNMQSNSTQVNTSDFASGFYLIQVRLTNGQFCVKKIVKE